MRNPDRLVYSVVIPVYNEEETLPAFHQRLAATLDRLNGPSEALYILDGPTDGSTEIVTGFAKSDSRVRVHRFETNRGQQRALECGLRLARGEKIAFIDADLQRPPEALETLFDALEEGNRIAFGVRVRRRDPMFRRAGSWISGLVLRCVGDGDGRDPLTGFAAFDQVMAQRLRRGAGRGVVFSYLFHRLHENRCTYREVPHFPRENSPSRYSLRPLLLLSATLFVNAVIGPATLANIGLAILIVVTPIGCAATLVHPSLAKWVLPAAIVIVGLALVRRRTWIAPLLRAGNPA